jgi:aminodeoxyfutalosine synthase
MSMENQETKPDASLTQELIEKSDVGKQIKEIANKILHSERITAADGVLLYEQGPLNFLGVLANFVREKKNGNLTYFNRNFHIEPTNICVFDCKFCSYSRLLKQKEQGWEMSREQILDIVKSYEGQPVTEVHIVGGVHPRMGLDYFAGIIRDIKAIRPDLHVKAFTAVELEYMITESCRTGFIAGRRSRDF